MSPSNMPAAEMLVTESRRQLVAQAATLEALRGRTIASLSVASLTAALFASHLPKHPRGAAHVAIVVALVAFGFSALLAANIIRPRKTRDGHSVARQVRRLRQGRQLRAYDLSVTWAQGYEDDRHFNEIHVDRLMTAFAWICVLIGAQIIAWTIAAVA